MPIRLCTVRKCGNEVAYKGRCAVHAREWERTTHPNRAIYNGKRWRYARRAQLQANSLCQECGRMATDVDHIVPIEHGGDVWDPQNHQSLCAHHHGVKTRKEQATQ